MSPPDRGNSTGAAAESPRSEAAREKSGVTRTRAGSISCGGADTCLRTWEELMDLTVTFGRTALRWHPVFGLLALINGEWELWSGVSDADRKTVRYHVVASPLARCLPGNMRDALFAERAAG